MTLLKTFIVSMALLGNPLSTFAEDQSHGRTGMSAGSKQLHDVMKRSAQEVPSMKMSGDVDRDFAKMMADHHRSAIEMAKIQAKHGKNDELKQLAQNIMSSQKQEISVLEKHSKMSH